MNIVISAAVIILGFLIFTKTVSNIALIVLFEIPVTNRLDEKCFLKPKKHLVASYVVAIFFHAVVLIATTLAMFRSNYFIYLIIGYAISAVVIAVKIKDHGFAMDNFSVYFEKNKGCFSEESVREYENDRVKMFNCVKGTSSRE